MHFIKYCIYFIQKDVCTKSYNQSFIIFDCTHSVDRCMVHNANKKACLNNDNLLYKLVDFVFIFIFFFYMAKKGFYPYSLAFINLQNLKHNLKIIKSLIKKPVKILIPVKSNAYGCGIVPVSKFLEQSGIDYLGAAYPYEGLLLRENRIKTPILVFSEVIYKQDYEMIIKNNLTPTVFTPASLKIFNQLGKKFKKKINIHINVDTGMGRIGVPFDEIFNFIKLLPFMNNIKLEGLYTHLSSADEKDRKFTLSQIERFKKVVSFTKEKNLNIPFIHVLNSAGIINYPEFCYDMIRPGIMFYGYFPDNKTRKNIKLKPCMDLKAKILFTKNVEKNTPVSYGHTYFSKKSETIASIGAGYGDGISRLLSNNGNVLYHDKKCPIRGRICMDQFMIDISNCTKPQKTDLITIFGKDKIKEIRLESVAEKLNTIPYEILCLIGDRVQRIYIK